MATALGYGCSAVISLLFLRNFTAGVEPTSTQRRGLDEPLVPHHNGPKRHMACDAILVQSISGPPFTLSCGGDRGARKGCRQWSPLAPDGPFAHCRFSLLPSSLPPSLSPPPLSLAPFLHLSPSVPPSLGVLPSSPPSCAFFRARALSRARVLALLLSRSLVLLLFHSLTLARSRERYLSLSRFPLPSSWPPLVLPHARSLELLFARVQSHLFAVH